MVLVAENLTVTRVAVQQAIERRDPLPLRDLARRAAAAGATYLDINLGSGRQGRGDSVSFVLDALHGHWHGAILADSADPRVVEQMARGWDGEVVANGYSGDEGRRGILEVAQRHGLQMVVLLMRKGIPKSAEERLALAVELIADCSDAGIAPERLWVDPLVAPLGWVEGQEYNCELLEVLRRLPDLVGEPVRTLLGLSNLTSGAAENRRVPWMQEVFLGLAGGAGLSHVLADVDNSRVCKVVKALSVFSGERLYAPEEFV